MQAQTAENDAHCLVCGLRLSTASEWCMETRDGDHRPTLPTRVIPPGQDQL
jgi:hypothetical protein